MRFRLFGIRFTVSVFFTAVIAFMLIVDRTGLMTPVLASTLLHELGHLAAMKRYRCMPREISLQLGTVSMVKPNRIYRRREEIMIAVCGPAANLLAGILFFTLYFYFKNESFAVWSIVQLAIGAFNLLPVLGLDGGSILLGIFSSLWDEDKALFILKFISIVVAGAAVACGAYLLLNGIQNPTLLLVGIYLGVLQIMKV